MHGFSTQKESKEYVNELCNVKSTSWGVYDKIWINRNENNFV